MRIRFQLVRGWTRVAAGALLVLVGVLATDNFVINGTPAAYNYGYYGGGTRLAIITGAGPGGGPHVRILNPANFSVDHTSPNGGFMAGSHSTGVFVARGDINGDGTTAEVIVGGGGVVRRYGLQNNGTATSLGSDIVPYGGGYTGEVRVAAADLNGDGDAEIITAAGPGGGPHIRAFNGDGTAFAGQMGSGIYAYASNFTGGVYVAAADLNADGNAEIITGAGPGGGPHVRGFNASGTKMSGQIGDGFYGFASNFAGGVRVAAGYFNNTGIATIVVAAGPGGGPHVRQFTPAAAPVAGQPGDGFYAFGPSFSGGVFVGVGDIDADEPAEIIVGAGAGGGPHVRVFKPNASPAPGQPGDGVMAFGAFTGGVTVAGGKV